MVADWCSKPHMPMSADADRASNYIEESGEPNTAQGNDGHVRFTESVLNATDKELPGAGFLWKTANTRD